MISCQTSMADLVLLPKVEEFLDDLEEEARAKVSIMIDLLEEYGYELREPHTKKLTKQLFELRSRGKQEVRLLFAYRSGKIFILTGFIKKSRKTPRLEIVKAERELNTLDI